MPGPAVGNDEASLVKAAGDIGTTIAGFIGASIREVPVPSIGIIRVPLFASCCCDRRCFAVVYVVAILVDQFAPRSAASAISPTPSRSRSIATPYVAGVSAIAGLVVVGHAVARSYYLLWPGLPRLMKVLARRSPMWRSSPGRDELVIGMIVDADHEPDVRCRSVSWCPRRQDLMSW